jgi:hypothetical protein
MSVRPCSLGSPSRDLSLSPMDHADHSHFLSDSGPNPWGPTTSVSTGRNAGGGSVSSDGGAASPWGLNGAAVSPTLSIQMGEVGTTYGHRMDTYPGDVLKSSACCHHMGECVCEYSKADYADQLPNEH